MTELRRICRDAGVRLEVIKNSLGRFAAQKAQVAELPEHFTGPTALATSETDEIAPAKVLTDFAKDHPGPKIRIGYVEGKIFGAEEVKNLASLPSKDVLLANLVRALMGPLTQFAMVLAAPVRDLAGVLNEVGKKSGGKGEAPEESPAGEG
jgi:large subunit ribosomal protein L10